MSTSPGEFPLWIKGRAFEDFHVGQQFDHHWGRTLERYDSTLFSSLTLYYVPAYLNEEAARERGRPAGLINPYLVFLLVLGMSVEDTSEGIDGAEGAFLGVKHVRFLADVVAGDTITAHTTVVAVRESNSRPQSGIVTWATSGRNQRGETVLEFERTNLVARRREVPEGSYHTPARVEAAR